MEEVEKTNAVVVRNPIQGQEEREVGIKRDLYAMEIDRRRNYYSCRGFGYLAQNYKNQGRISQERRIEYRDNESNSNNLKEEENLVVSIPD